jgi:ketosteroid isomerase-like protein
VLKSTIEWRDREGDHDLRVDRIEQRNGHYAVVISWAERDGTRHEWAHLLRLRDGEIVDMEDYATGKRALRALRRRRGLLAAAAG